MFEVCCRVVLAISAKNAENASALASRRRPNLHRSPYGCSFVPGTESNTTSRLYDSISALL